MEKKENPISWRPPKDLRDRMNRDVKENSRNRNQLITDIISNHYEQLDAEQPMAKS